MWVPTKICSPTPYVAPPHKSYAELTAAAANRPWPD